MTATGLRIEIVRSPELDNVDEGLAAYRWHAFVPGPPSPSEGEGIFVVDRHNGGARPLSDADEEQPARTTALVVLGNELRDRQDGDLPERVDWIEPELPPMEMYRNRGPATPVNRGRPKRPGWTGGHAGRMGSFS